MKFRKSSRTIGYRITRAIFLIGYIASLVVLGVEAGTPKKESSAKSNEVGAAIENILNDINGDTSKEIIPTSCSIGNTKFDYHVGDSVQLIVNTNPSDATYQSYTYTSSDSEVASINETGEIHFLKEGSAVISAVNTKKKEINAEATFTVTNVVAQSFKSTINATLENGVYKLETSSTYLVTNTFTPSNTTFKQVRYEYNESLGYIQMVDDTIKILKESEDTTIELKVYCHDLETPNVLKLKTYFAPAEGELYSLVGFKVSNVTKYIDQTSAFTPSISYNPSYVSDIYKGYTLTSSNTNVIKVNGTKLVPQGVIGSSTITVTSAYDPSITATFVVSVKDRGTLSGVSISRYSDKMYVGTSQKLTVSTSPSSNVVLTKSFISSNPGVATVDNSGKVTAVSVGTTNVTFSATDTIHNVIKTNTVSISVLEIPSEIVTDIEVEALQGDSPVLFTGEKVNLKDYYGISKFIGKDNVDDTSYKFYVNTSVYNATLDSNKINLTPNMVGSLVVNLEYTNEVGMVISKEVNFTVISKFDVTFEDEVVESYDIYIGESEDFKIKTKHENLGQTYVASTNNDVFTITLDGEGFHAFAAKAGECIVTLTPLFEDSSGKHEVNVGSITFTLNGKDIYTKSLTVKFIDKQNLTYEVDQYNSFILYMDNYAKCDAKVDAKATKSDIIITAQSDIVSIKNNVVTPVSVGDVQVSVMDTYSQISRSFIIKVRNKVAVDENSAFTISGVFEYSAETNTLTIINGNSVKIRYNFAGGTTYKETTYVSSNEKVATVGQDGTITPIKVGKTVLKMEVRDDMSIHLSSEVTIKIIKKNFVQNVEEFMKTVRKLVGHFGAFAVLGFFSTMTYFMFFRKELFPIGVAVNFSTGFAYAAFTEWVQTMTPGRAGLFSDVLIDFYGFLLTAGAITLIILIAWLITLLVKKIRNKKQNETGTISTNQNQEPNIIDEMLENNEKEENNE